MKAKKKPFKKLTLKDLGLEDQVTPRQEILKVAEPPKRQGGAKVGFVTTATALHCFDDFTADASLLWRCLHWMGTGGERRRAHFQAQGGWSYLSSKRHHGGDGHAEHSTQKASKQRRTHRLNLDLKFISHTVSECQSHSRCL